MNACRWSASRPRRAGAHDDPVRLAALPPGEVRLEEQRAVVEPRERALDGRIDGDERPAVCPGRSIAEGDRHGGEARHVLAAGRGGHGGTGVGDGHAERDVAVAVVPAGAVPVVEEEADLSQRVPVAARDARADVDPKRLVHVLRDANLDAVDRDVAEAVVAAAAEAVVEEEANGSQRVSAATRGASADEEAQGVAHVLPDAHVHVDGAGSGAGIGGGWSGAGDEHKRQQEGAQASVGRGRSRSHRGSFPDVPARSDRPWRRAAPAAADSTGTPRGGAQRITDTYAISGAIVPLPGPPPSHPCASPGPPAARRPSASTPSPPSAALEQGAAAGGTRDGPPAPGRSAPLARVAAP